MARSSAELEEATTGDKGMTTVEKAILAARFADAKKAEDITAIDLSGLCTFTDAFVICTGSSGLQLRAIAQSVLDGMREHGIRARLEGDHPGMTWVVLDIGDVVVHVMSREARELYRLENLWGDGREVRWEG